MTLNASAENGASSEAARSASALVLGSMPAHRRNVERARQVVDDRVEQRLDALVLERRAEQHRRELARERRLAQRAPDLVGGDRVLVEDVGLEQLVVEVRDRVDQLVVVLVRLLGELGGDLGDVELLAEVVLVDDRLHLDEVDDAREVLLLPDRKLHRHGVRAQPVAHRGDGGEEVRAGAVHLVDERDPRDAGTCRPGARRSPTAAGHRRPSRRRRPRRRARAGCARPRP